MDKMNTMVVILTCLHCYCSESSVIFEIMILMCVCNCIRTGYLSWNVVIIWSVYLFGGYSEEEAKKKIYSVSTTYTGFGCLISEELSYKVKGELTYETF